ncbi:MAG: hypothetical protein C0424_04680 [Sphingobacteriaceae bacterium]|nr:hypothetical protein [Sphingobacteriaceae bacterium]
MGLPSATAVFFSPPDGPGFSTRRKREKEAVVHGSIWYKIKQLYKEHFLPMLGKEDTATRKDTD